VRGDALDEVRRQNISPLVLAGLLGDRFSLGVLYFHTPLHAYFAFDRLWQRNVVKLLGSLVTILERPVKQLKGFSTLSR